jgi:ubiquinone/menaquinone biosynthesis C-methylase UbiE
LTEIDEIKRRYRERESLPANRYNYLSPAIYMGEQEKEKALIKFLEFANLGPVKELKLLEIGCGAGNNLLEFIRLGFLPENLTGVELLTNRVKEAKGKLPSAVSIIEGDALEVKFDKKSYDIVFQSMVFSSILDIRFQNSLALKMSELTKEKGGILWYDFTFDNPKNKDVMGIKYNRVKELFPDKKIKKWKITLAPPLSRVVTKIHPNFYSVFNLIPFLRTHILCWIYKS